MGVPRDPEALGLDRLFVKPSMFDSRDAFRAAGFDGPRQFRSGQIMVGAHASVPGYLFKKYPNEVSLDDQHDNYDRRLEGAERLRRFVEKHALGRIVVPHKWLYKLPDTFFDHRRSSYVLVVERLPILDEYESVKRYREIDKDLLTQLCMVLFEFRGLDSTPRNVAFTADDQIAFVDLENWQREPRTYLRYIGEHLSKKRRHRAEKIFRRLEGRDWT
jgi:hypothetical protein